MGRAGSGRAGGSRSSGSRSSGSRSSGSHRVSSSRSSSRAGSSSRSSFGGSSIGRTPSFSAPRPPRHTPPPPSHHHYAPPPPRHHHHHHHVPRRHYSTTRTVYVGNSSSSSSTSLVAFFMVLVVLICVFRIGALMLYAIGSGESSTIQRYKLETSYGYDNNCIVDELGWFDNSSKTASRLKDFYNETGVQPYIVLLDYDASLKNDSEKEAYAETYFETEGLNENGFLFIYFAEQNTDDDVGLMCYVNGLQTSSVMDTEAVDIFWNYVDRYWYTDMSTDDMFVNIFDDTADVIMHVSTTGKDVAFALVILITVTVGGSVLIKVIKLRNKRKAEEAAETAKILSTPLEKISDEDDLTKKYSDS